MKNLNLLLATISFVILITSCGTSKKVITQTNETTTKQTEEKSTKELKSELEETKERIALEQEIERLKVEHENEMKKLEAQGRVLGILCEDDAYDGEGYMAGLGIAEGKADKGEGMSVALKRANAEIMNKFLGAFKNGIEEYTKDTRVPSDQKRDMAKIEGGVQAAGENAINKYAKIVCRKVAENPVGGYDIYIAVHVSTAEVKKEIASQLEEMEVDFNTDVFFDTVDKNLEAQKKYKEKKEQDTQKNYEIQ
ncbi:hypothetical protein KAH94_06555 [bacterium]|nr:hypothetical protein [bacterium]